jgi:hypothetical protein
MVGTGRYLGSLSTLLIVMALLMILCPSGWCLRWPGQNWQMEGA